MTLQKIPDLLGFGGAHLNHSTLRPILVELQGLKATVVNGAAPATNIPLAGIATEDTLVGVAKLDFTLTEGMPNTRTWAAADLLSEASIMSAGNIQLSTTDTTGAVLLVLWFDKQ